MHGLDNKRLLVVGLGKSGMSVCRFLYRAALPFDVADSRSEPPGLAELQSLVPDVVMHPGFTADLFCQYDVLIVSPGLALAELPLSDAVTAGVEVIGDIEIFARLVQMPVIAVTGSNGKSTVVAWATHVLHAAGKRAVACGNIGTPVLDALHENDEADVDVYVVELSSFQLETTSNLQTLAATVLNVSEDHMDRYDDLEHYARTKQRIYADTKLCVVNADDSNTLPGAAQEDLPRRVVSSTTLNNADYRLAERGEALWLAAPAGLVMTLAELPLPGRHNAFNALAVLALCESFDLSVDALKTGLAGFRGLPHRIELVRDDNGVRWFNDSKGTNVDAACRAIESMGRPVVLIAGGIGKDADFSPLKPIVGASVKALILIGRDADSLENLLGDVTECYRAATLDEAVQIASQVAEPGDAVLLSPACSSFDMFDSFEHRGNEFSRCVRELAA